METGDRIRKNPDTPDDEYNDMGLFESEYPYLFQSELEVYDHEPDADGDIKVIDTEHEYSYAYVKPHMVVPVAVYNEYLKKELLEIKDSIQ